MKKLLFAIPDFRGGGAENVFVLLANYFSASYSVHFAVLSQSGPNRKRLIDSIQVFELKATSSIRAIPELNRIIAKNNIDVIIGTLAMAHAVSIAKLTGSQHCKYIARLGNTITHDLKNHSFLKRIIMTFYQKALYFADTVICQSEGMQTDLKKFISKKSALVYNPIDYALIHNLKNQHTIPLINSNNFNIVAVGRLTPQKDYFTAIDTFAIIQQHISKSEFYILGEGYLYKPLQEYAKNLNLLNKIHFLGHINNPFPIISKANVFLLTSKYEGFSNVILEALTLEIPVVATNSPGGNSEIIKHGINGFLASVGDSSALSQYILKIYSGYSFTFNMDSFHLDIIGQQYEKLFFK
jgi:glycosyltransferase involved in cell wall biosynthesis